MKNRVHLSKIIIKSLKYKQFFSYRMNFTRMKFKIKRHSSIVKKPKPKIGKIKNRNLIASSCESLSARGFLRSFKPYKPAENVREVVLELCSKELGSSFDQDLALSKEKKFALLNSCFEKINHSVPNSLLHKVVSVKDLIEFYETPVSTTVPYDELKNQQLPPNLHIQSDYVRFDPKTDTKFKGISAFPKSSTNDTGIKYKGNYKGLKADSPFEDTETYIKKNALF